MQTALAYLDAYFAGEAQRLTTLSEHHLHEELEAAKARLSSSAGASQEVLALSSSLGLAEDESEEVRQQQSAATIALERWVGIQAEVLVAPSVAVPVDEATFVSNHPLTLASHRDVDVARHAAVAAATNRKPNWVWELSYGQRTGYSDMVSFGLSIPLPMAPAQRQDRETASKLALVDKAQAMLAEASRAATAEYRALTSDARRLADRSCHHRHHRLVGVRARWHDAWHGVALRVGGPPCRKTGQHLPGPAGCERLRPCRRAGLAAGVGRLYRHLPDTLFGVS